MKITRRSWVGSPAGGADLRRSRPLSKRAFVEADLGRCTFGRIVTNLSKWFFLFSRLFTGLRPNDTVTIGRM